MADREECAGCGTWTCLDCGWKRTRANLDHTHTCGSCDSSRGEMRPTRHRRPFLTREHGPEANHHA